MEHTKAYEEYKKNGNTKFVRYSTDFYRVYNTNIHEKIAEQKKRENEKL